jgi:hypothetical protein
VDMEAEREEGYGLVWYVDEHMLST